MRHRDQRPPDQRLGAHSHRSPPAIPAHPPPDLPPGPADLLSLLRPGGQAGPLTYFITIAGRRWPVEETGKDALGWDQCQARAWDATCRHTALAALAQLRQAVIRNALCGGIPLPAVPAAPGQAGPDSPSAGSDDNADLRIPLGDAPVPAYPGQPRRTASADQAVGRRDRPAHAPGHRVRRRTHHPRPPRIRAALVRLATAPPGRRPMAPPRRPAGRGSNLNPGDRKKVTACKRGSQPMCHGTRQDELILQNRDCNMGRGCCGFGWGGLACRVDHRGPAVAACGACPIRPVCLVRLPGCVRRTRGCGGCSGSGMRGSRGCGHSWRRSRGCGSRSWSFRRRSLILPRG